MATVENTYSVKIQQLLEGHVEISAASRADALGKANMLYNFLGTELPDMDDVAPLKFSIDDTRPHPDMHYDQSEILREILKLAKAELNENGAIGYTMPDGKYHMYIYVEDSFGTDDRHYVLEPNRVVDGGHEPMGDTTCADYNDFGELMLGCTWCMEQFEADRPIYHEAASERIPEPMSTPYVLHPFIEQEVPFRLTQCLGYKVSDQPGEKHVTRAELDKLIAIVKNHDDCMFDFDAFDQYLEGRLEEMREQREFPSLTDQMSDASSRTTPQSSINHEQTSEREF